MDVDVVFDYIAQGVKSSTEGLRGKRVTLTILFIVLHDYVPQSCSTV